MACRCLTVLYFPFSLSTPSSPNAFHVTFAHESRGKRLDRVYRYITHACGWTRYITHVFCGWARYITHTSLRYIAHAAICGSLEQQGFTSVIHSRNTRARFFNFINL